MIVGVPSEVKTDEYRVALTPAGVRELTSAGHTVFVAEGRGRRLVHARRRLRPHRGQDRRRRRRGVGRGRPRLQGEGADRPRSSTLLGAAHGPDALHLPAPGRLARVHRRAGRRRQRGHRLRDGAPGGQLAAAAGAHERGGRPDGAADGRPPPHAARRRPGRPGVRRARRALRPCRHPRRRRGRLRRRHHGRRHALRGLRPRPQPRPPARGGPPLPGRARDHRLVGARHRGGLPRGRHRHRRRARRRRPGTAPGLRRAGRADAARVRCWSTSRSTRAAASSRPTRPRTRTRPSRCTGRSSTAWPTCPARCRTRRPTRWPTPRCPTR